MTAITIFSTCRPFEGVYGQIQHNALASWAKMKQQVILFGSESHETGISRAARNYNFELVGIDKRKDWGYNKYGTPLVDFLFETAELLALRNILCYCNADIILHGLVKAAEIVAGELDQFLIVGRRWDIDNVGTLKFESGWHEKLKQIAKLHSPTGIDYFIFTKALWPIIPSFALGHYGWDNWLVDDALSRNKPVIDATKSITAIHQEHPRYPRRGPQWKRNMRLFGNRHGRGTTNHATWILNEEGLRRK